MLKLFIKSFALVNESPKNFTNKLADTRYAICQQKNIVIVSQLADVGWILQLLTKTNPYLIPKLKASDTFSRLCIWNYDRNICSNYDNHGILDISKSKTQNCE